MLKQTSW